MCTQSAELYPANAITTKTVNLVNGENFDPSFIGINPSATLPTLTADGKSYRNTTDVILYLVANAPTRSPPQPLTKPSLNRSMKTNTIPTLHCFSFAMTPNVSPKLARCPRPLSRIIGQATLVKHSQDSANSRYAAFYAEKLAGNGALLDIYTGTNKNPSAFYAQSQEHFSNLKYYLYTILPSVLPADGFIAGTTPGEADFHHVAAWLTRISATSGATSAADALVALEKIFREPVPEVVRNYARVWIVRDSWKRVYAAGLH
ncbi:uncharacterized protein EV420DRAFT_1693564 [Desarmillaria tabescens]|uniref:GST N-terminal domain-containing protein n=1 Tax=Armillaria tabescens TaxID=1929756 RepID=A0AA39N2G9_ARMTA|nr:uncharacterized protein EV420DRAFT_1693564 [Desarmillaria tabescens]KAK0455522.1 hypothetical protein EV420DRAFT_1693564 [Desarmillaria tabescens]